MSLSEELPHQKFERLVREGGLGTLERLPANCLATYAYRRNECEESMVLPLKFVAETESKRWNWNYGQWRGIQVNWMTSEGQVLIIDTKDLSSLRTRTSTILRQFGGFVGKINDVAQRLSEFDKTEHHESLERVLRSTRYEVISREQILATRESTNLLEADAHDELKSLLGDSLHLTPEKCKADFAYTLGDMTLCLPVQTKSATLKKDGKTMNMFHNTSGYDTMILCCRPMRRLYLGTVVIPGSLAPKDLGLALSDDSKYGKFIVPDPMLDEFMARLYKAVLGGEISFIWPSGVNVAISAVVLQTFEDLCVPEGDANKAERESSLIREKSFPALQYEYPRVQASTVDIIINGIRIQDKHGVQRENERYIVPLKKRNGRNGRGKLQNLAPYTDNDFDCLWVHLAKNRRFFFVIPARILAENGILQTKASKGKGQIVCFLRGFERRFNGNMERFGIPWTRDYCFDYEDPGVASKVVAILESCKSTIDTTAKC